MAITGFQKSLLGFDPYDVRQKQMQQMFAPITQAQDPYAKIGAALGVLGGTALFGMPQDPRLKMATEVQQIVKGVMGDAPDQATFEEKLPLLKQAFSDKGLIDQALIVDAKIKELTPKKDIKTVDGSLVDITDVNNPKVLFTAPGKNIKAVGKSLIDLSDLSNPKVVFKDPEASLRTVGSSVIDFSKPYDPKVLYTDPNANVKTVGDSVIDFTNPKKPKVLFTKPEKPKIIETPTDMAGIAKYLGIPVKTNMDDYTQTEMQAIQAEVVRRQKEKEDMGSTGIQRQRFEAEQEEKRQKKEASLVASITSVNSMLSDVFAAKNLVSEKTAGVSGLLKFFPETKARKLNNKIETIKANLGFNELKQMREASPTGGALGQVAVQELNFLQATVAKLDQYESAEDLNNALDEVKKHYDTWLLVVKGEMSEQKALQLLEENMAKLEAQQKAAETEDQLKKQQSKGASGSWRLLN